MRRYVDRVYGGVEWQREQRYMESENDAIELEQIITALANAREKILAIAFKGPTPPLPGSTILVRDTSANEFRLRVFAVEEYSPSSKRAYGADWKLRCSGLIFGESVWYKFMGVINS